MSRDVEIEINLFAPLKWAVIIAIGIFVWYAVEIHDQEKTGIAGTYTCAEYSGSTQLELKPSGDFFFRVDEFGRGVAGEFSVKTNVLTMVRSDGLIERLSIKDGALIDKYGNRWTKKGAQPDAESVAEVAQHKNRSGSSNNGTSAQAFKQLSNLPLNPVTGKLKIPYDTSIISVGGGVIKNRQERNMRQ